MSLTESNMLPLGTDAPQFSLPDTISGQNVSLADYNNGKALVMMFICNHCPYVIHLNEEIVSIANDYQSKGVDFIAISSNDAVNYPQDGPAEMTKHAAENDYNFPYLFDETQEVAKAYDAACTPDFYIFDQEKKLFYRGRLDGSRPGNSLDLTGEDLRAAIDDVLEGKAAPETQYPSAGCNIKWK